MIIVRVWEGLGNQLFQYAYGRALELRTRQKVYYDIERCFSNDLEKKRTPREYGLDKFNTRVKTKKDIEKGYLYFKEKAVFIKKFIFQTGILFYKIYKEDNVAYKEELKALEGNYYLMGWFQNENYFKEFRKELLRELTPKKKIKISSNLKKILQYENTVSIHIRRGDYKKMNNVLSFSYYEKAVLYMKDNIKEPIFLVFSDEIEWVKEHIDFKANVIYVTEKQELNDYEELLVMSKCKHNIIANSTFSWWGAWLNTNDNKIVIGPKNWFGSKGQNAGLNIMPEDWIRM